MSKLSEIVFCPVCNSVCQFERCVLYVEQYEDKPTPKGDKLVESGCALALQTMNKLPKSSGAKKYKYHIFGWGC